MRERPLSLALHDLQSAGKTSKSFLADVQSVRKTSFLGFVRLAECKKAPKSLLADVQSVGKTSFLDFARFLKYILCLFHLVCLLYG